MDNETFEKAKCIKYELDNKIKEIEKLPSPSNSGFYRTEVKIYDEFSKEVCTLHVDAKEFIQKKTDELCMEIKDLKDKFNKL